MTSRVVTGRSAGDTSPVTRAWQLLADVPDPELPAVSVVDLGIVRDVAVSPDGRSVTVTLTPTYSGCPATAVIADDVRTALRQVYDDVQVETRLSPAWTTDWLTDAGRDKLRGFGIAGPSPGIDPQGRPTLAIADVGSPAACPHCDGGDLEELAAFGSTPCQALWRCRSCREPFSYMKRH